MKDKTYSQGLRILSGNFRESGNQNSEHSPSSDAAKPIPGLQKMHVLFSVCKKNTLLYSSH